MAPKTPKTKKPPALPPAIKPPEEISEAAMRAGSEEGRSLRQRVGRQSTYITTPGLMVPANIDRKRLKTKLG